MSGTAAVGTRFPPAQATAEAEKIRAFARAIGESDPIYFDEAEAIRAGYRGLPAPPTYVFCLKHQAADPQAILADIGLGGQAGKLLHAEQSFEFREPICAGDVLTFAEKVADIYDKKGGALRFVVLETTVTNQTGTIVAIVAHTEVIRMDM